MLIFLLFLCFFLLSVERAVVILIAPFNRSLLYPHKIFHKLVNMTSVVILIAPSKSVKKLEVISVYYL